MCYFGYLFDYTDAVVAGLAHHMNNPIFGRVDFVVGIGLSGTLPLVPLRQATRCHVLPLRKKVSSHSGVVYAPEKGQRYLIVDDFINSGSTVAGVLEYMAKFQCECAGVLCYQDGNREPYGYDGHVPEGLPTLGIAQEVVMVDKMVREEGYEL